MKKRVGSNSKQYKSFRELKKELTTTKEVIVLGIFESNKKTEYDSQSQFFKASDRLRQSVLFRHVFIDSVPEVYDFDLLKNLRDMSPPNIVLIRPKHLRNKFEPNYVVYAFGDIKDFIKINYHGLVGFRNRSNIDYFEVLYFSSYLTIIINYF
jgi:protein disulfide isomerase family A protein 3